MRSHAVTALGAACVAALAMAVAAPAGAASARPSAAAAGSGQPGSAPARGAASRTSPVTGSTPVLLPTGDRLLVGRSSTGSPRITVAGTMSGGTATAFTTPKGTVVIPASVRAVVGKVLDPALFNATAIAAAPGGRTPVAISYATATAPTAVAGVEVTKRSGLTGSGFITPASSRALGKSLATVNAATLFANVAGVRFAGATVPVPAWPMHTVTIKAVNDVGAPLSGLVLVMSVDDPTKFNGFAFVDRGTAKMSLPTGTYQAFASEPNADFSVFRFVATPEFVVSSPRTATVDLRTATTPFSTSADVRLGSGMYITEFSREITSEVGFSSVSLAVISDEHTMVRLSPTTGTLHGTQRLARYVGAPGAPSAGTATSYTLYYHHDGRIPATQIRLRSTAADRMTYHSRFYGPADTTNSLFSSGATPASGGWSMGAPLTARAVTRHVSVGPGIVNGAEYIQYVDWDTFAVRGWFRAPEAEYAARTVLADDWAKAPLHGDYPAVPPYPGAPEFCSACIGSNQVSLLQLPMMDNTRRHYGNADSTADGSAQQASFVVRADGKTIASASGSFLNTIAAYPAGTKVISATQTSWRGGVPFPVRSTLTTDVSTPLAAAIPRPAGWGCDLGEGSGCKVLPVLSATYDAPVTPTGGLRPGATRIGLTVNQLGRVTAQGVETVGAWISYDSGKTWSSASVTGSGAAYVIGATVPQAGTGRTTASLRVRITDRAGSSMTETMINAFLLTR